MNFDKPIDKLLYLMERLRDPDTGCPWDLKQTYDTIAPYTIEEAYEVVDAIDKQDYDHLKEEVGDLLIQVVFYAQLAKEDKYFDFDGVVSALNEKLIRRHPHVFPEGTATSRIDPNQVTTDEQVAQNWQLAKLKEQESKNVGDVKSSLLSDVHAGIPPMLRAVKLQKKAAEVGFDWDSVKPVLDKVNEEVAELNQAINEAHSHEAILGELGDVLFCCINLARHLKIDPDLALRTTNSKFIRRFSRVEELVAQDGETISELGLERLDSYWDQVKSEEVEL